MKTIIIDLDKLARNALEGIAFALLIVATYAVVELIDTPDRQVKAGVTAHPARGSVTSPNPVIGATVSFPVGADADQKQAAPQGVSLLREESEAKQ